MNHPVVLDVPDDLARRAEALAAQAHSRLEDVLLAWLTRGATEAPLETLSDGQILALCDSMMPDEQQRTLSDLLARQREGLLTDDDRSQLALLMEAYRRGMVQKAQALKVAVERGLRPSLTNE